MESQLISRTTVTLDELENAFNALVREIEETGTSQTNTQSSDQTPNQTPTPTPSEEPSMPPLPLPVEEHPDLPINSPTYLQNEYNSRFSNAQWADAISNISVTIAGLGGIGSFAAFLIGRLRPSSIVLYDMDSIDSSNLSGQLFRRADIGRTKTNAVANLIRESSSYYNIQERAEFTNNSVLPTEISISGFDNMKARKTFFEVWESRYHIGTDHLFIDGRLAMENFQVFCFTGKDTYLINKYKNQWLFDDDEAEETICSMKQTSFCSNMIGSIITNLVVNYVCNLADNESRVLPFLTTYNATTMSLRIEES